MPDFTIETYLKKIKQAAINSFKACGYEAITVDSTVKRLTIPTDAKYALIRLESSVAAGVAIRCLQSTVVAVSTTVGIGMENGDRDDITDAQNLAGFQVTQAQAGTHTLHVEYYK